MVELPAVGPLATPCSRALDELLGQKPKTKLGRCGKLSCEFCGTYELVIEVAATASALDDHGGRAIVCTPHEVPLNLPPVDVHSLIGPRLAEAMEALVAKYIGGLSARWTIEQDAQGRANVHVLEWGPSVPKIGTLRRTFEAAGLGRHVAMEDILNPLTLACYVSKVGLAAFAVSSKHRAAPLSHALQFNGGHFAQTTPGFYEVPHTLTHLEAQAELFCDEVVVWATHWKHFADKLPAQLHADLLPKHTPTPSNCQSDPQESSADEGDIGPWGLKMP